MKRLGIVSDTHGQVPSTMAAVRMLESLEVELVIHCGDIGGEDIPPLFSQWPTHFVFGNVDDPGPLRPAIAGCSQFCHEQFGTLEIEGCKIAFLHGHDGRRLDQVIANGRFALVCHGHTHRRRLERVGDTLVLNPGALHRAVPHSLAIVDVPSLETTSIVV